MTDTTHKEWRQGEKRFSDRIMWEGDMAVGEMASPEIAARVVAAMNAQGEPVRDFARAILHGDDVHRQWLSEAAEAWCTGKPLPPPRSAASVAAPAQPVRPFIGAKPLQLLYTNWRGETSVRRIIPLAAPRTGTTEWHPEPQWLLRAWDVDRGAEREFALTGFADAPLQPAEGVDLTQMSADIVEMVRDGSTCPSGWDFELSVEEAQGNVRVLLDDARAALASRPAEGWRDIASAPKDDTRVLLSCPKTQVIGRYRSNNYEEGLGWTTDDGESVRLTYDSPTHWMPLPIRADSGGHR